MLADFKSRHLSAQERAAVDAAIAAGRVTRCPPATACGLSWAERMSGIVAQPEAIDTGPEQRRKAAYQQRAGDANRRRAELARTAR
ncbi:MAG: hypothetical protein GC145_14520 [Caulobacter sp.]|nr:hypothetical protein [Caulobacter sp.]